MTISTLTNEQLKYYANATCGGTRGDAGIMARELLTVRESQGIPIGCIKTISGNKTLKWWRDAPEGAEVFTAPPAPAVPDELVAALDWIDDFIARCNGDDRGACNSVNVLRAAMLQHVNQAYTFNSPVIPDGWKLVPNEPTTKQWAAGYKAMEGGIDKVTLAYRAMVAEAPKPDGEDL